MKRGFEALIVIVMLCLISTVSTALAGFQSSTVMELNITAGEWDDHAPIEEQPMQVEPFEHMASGEGRIVIGPAREDQNFNNQNNPVVFSGRSNNGIHAAGGGKIDR